MRIVAIAVVAVFVSSCEPQAPLPAARESSGNASIPKTRPVEIPRELALQIAGEIVAAQRLERARPDTSDNEPDLIVRQVFAVPNHPEFAIVVCQYRSMLQGYALLVRHDHLGPPTEIAAFVAGPSDVEAVRMAPTEDGDVIIEVSHSTSRGNDAGKNRLLLRRDRSVKWLSEVSLP